MSAAIKLLKAAAGNAGGSPVYVDDVFSTDVWDANGSARNITNSVDLSGEGGLVWIKVREATNNNVLYDTVRGAGKQIVSNSTGAESTRTDTLTTFNNNGYALGADASYGTVNYTSNGKYVGWTFRKQPGFFDIVTYTGTGNTTGGSPQWREISHNLGTAPGMIIVKKTSGTGDWYVWHRGLADDSVYAAQTGFLNQSANFGGYNGFQTAANQTAAHFSLRQNSSGQTNDSGATYVAYLFAHDAQDFGTDSDEAIIKCGSYTGNGSSTGPTVDLGFEPQWLLFKKATGSAEEWIIHDNMRGLHVGGNDAELLPASGSQEYSSYAAIDVTATGFNITHTSARYNENSQTYIYMAIRRPHKPASEFAATDLFSQSMGLNASTGGKVYATTYPVDFHFAKGGISATGDWYLRDRLRGGNLYLNPNDPRAESSHAYNNEFDHMDGIYTETALDNTGSIGYQFRRAPGFMDVVAYTGSGSGSTVVKHNLGVVPEMVWRKRRDASQQYYIWASALSGAGTAQANGNFYTSSQGFSNGQYYAGDTQFDNITPPTATEFTQGALKTSSAQYVIYLFASVAGISKIGTYTGTGSDLNVDCGFSAGARFVIIKKTSGNGAWYVFDTVRGIVAGNDPYLTLHTGNAQSTGYDYIDPLSSGFSLPSAASGSTNQSGETYLFFAIA